MQLVIEIIAILASGIEPYSNSRSTYLFSNHKTSQAGINLIKKWEGCHDILTNPGKITANLCPASEPTIGFGSTRMLDGRPVRYSANVNGREVITISEAKQLLTHEISNMCEPAIARHCKVLLVQ